MIFTLSLHFLDKVGESFNRKIAILDKGAI